MGGGIELVICTYLMYQEQQMKGDGLSKWDDDMELLWEDLLKS